MTSVNEQIGALREAIAAAGPQMDRWVAERATTDLARIEDRLAAGEGVTVAALAGGTGSGKSTLFNAITELDFADSGYLRPTTEEAAACMWSTDATRVLDMIGVRPERRIQYHSMLTEGHRELDSLVLLDLPDHDSVDVRNAALVDRVLPLVDVLVWVVDPQKYADHLIHSSYMAAMKARRDNMIVVVNQIDTVPADQAETLVNDVRRLLEEDGLGDVPVFPVSALYRRGLDSVYSTLASAVAATEASVATARAEVAAVRDRLSDQVGGAEPALRPAHDDAVASFWGATGAGAVTESLKQAGHTLGAVTIAPPDQPAAAVTTAARDAWLAAATDGLPAAWQAAVVSALPDADKIRRAVGGSVRKVDVPTPRRGGPLACLALSVLLFALALVVGGLGLFGVSGAAARLACIAAGCVVLGCGYALARRMKRVAAVRDADTYRAAATSSLDTTITAQLDQPTAAVLDQHRRVRELLAQGAA